MDHFAQQDRNSMVEKWLSSSSSTQTNGDGRTSCDSKTSVSGFVDEDRQDSRQDFDHNHNNGE